MRVVVSGAEFGWGSAGKLNAILEVLRTRRPDVHVIGLGTKLGRGIVSKGLVDEWSDGDVAVDGAMSRAIGRARADAAIVVLDPKAADLIAAAGCPVVYVDSLPYLWTEHDPLPRAAACYCAQRSVPLPERARRLLASVPNLTWVEPIVSPRLTQAAAKSIQADCVLVTVGGVHSETAADEAASQYLATILPPVADAARTRGARRLVLAGNVGVDDIPPIDGIAVELVSGDQSAFFAQLRSARWIVASPGLTTILEVAALGRSAVLLPPQNLSQLLHGDHVKAAVDPSVVVDWPSTVLRHADVRGWHARGEVYALKRIYAAIRRVAQRPQTIHDQLREAIGRGLDACDAAPDAYSTLVRSARGADTVVDRLLALTHG